MKIRKTLATSVLIPLELTGAGSAEDAAIHKKFFWIRSYFRT